MISRDFVHRYLFTARWRHRVERLRKQWLVSSNTSSVLGSEMFLVFITLLQKVQIVFKKM